MNSKNTFSYTYSAKENQEVLTIRKKYMPQAETKMDRLRKLDCGATQKAQVRALFLGILGILILGAGMSLSMSDFGTKLGLQGNLAMLIGVTAGIAGMVLAALAYPVYIRLLRRERQRIAPEILRLADELMK